MSEHFWEFVAAIFTVTGISMPLHTYKPTTPIMVPAVLSSPSYACLTVSGLSESMAGSKGVDDCEYYMVDKQVGRYTNYQAMPDGMLLVHGSYKGKPSHMWVVADSVRTK